MCRNNLMAALKLHDGTVILSQEFKVGNKAILVENFKYFREDENPQFVDDPMTVHTDAIEVYFIIHEGGKEEANGKEIPEGGHDPPASA